MAFGGFVGVGWKVGEGDGEGDGEGGGGEEVGWVGMSICVYGGGWDEGIWGCAGEVEAECEWDWGRGWGWCWCWC